MRVLELLSLFLPLIKVQAGLRPSRSLWDMKKHAAQGQLDRNGGMDKSPPYYSQDDDLYNLIVFPKPPHSDTSLPSSDMYAPDDDLYGVIHLPKHSKVPHKTIPPHPAPPKYKYSTMGKGGYSSKSSKKHKGSSKSGKHTKKKKRSFTSHKQACYGRHCRDGTSVSSKLLTHNIITITDDYSSKYHKLQKPTPAPTSSGPPTFFPPVLLPPSTTGTGPPNAPAITPFPTAQSLTASPVTEAPSTTTIVATSTPVASSSGTDAPVLINATPGPGLTNAPTPATPPTPATLAPTTEFPTAVPTLLIIDNLPLTKAVTTMPFYVSLTGSFDPIEDEERIFDVVETNFRPYSKAMIGDMLMDYQMFFKFLEDRTTTLSGRRLQQNVSTMVEIIVVFTLSGSDSEQFEALDSERLSRTVQRYFLAGHKDTLLEQLNAAGIGVSDMQVFASLPPKDPSSPSNGGDVPTDGNTDDEATEAPHPHGPNPIDFAGDHSAMNRSRSTSAVIAAVISGVIIFVALGAVLVSNRRRQRNRFIPSTQPFLLHQKPPSITGDGSSVADGSVDAVSYGHDHIKPAALHVRNQRQRDEAVKASSNSTISSIPSANSPHFAVKPAPGHANRYESSSASSQSSHEEQKKEITETALVLLDDKPNKVAEGALKCLDSDVSVGELVNTYPEFELYQGSTPPTSPQWHADNFSVSTPYSAEEEYLKARKRWHEEANDLQSIALPDHNSEMGYTHHSQSVTGDSTAAKSKNSSRSY